MQRHGRITQVSERGIAAGTAGHGSAQGEKKLLWLQSPDWLCRGLA